MRYLPSVILLFFIFSLSAQQDWSLNDLNRKVKDASFADVDATIKGSRYLTEEFISGAVLLADSSFYNNVLLRYDAFEDEIEIQHDNHNFRLPSRGDVLYAVIGEDTLVSEKSIISGHEHLGYFFLLQRGPVSLYAKRGKAYKRAEEPQGFQDARPAEYVKKSDEYFWSMNGNSLFKVGKKKAVYAFLENEDVISFIKTEKLSLRDEDDLIRIINYYNNIK